MMTKWVDNPKLVVDVNHGKGANVVTGKATLTFVNDYVVFGTDGAHVNDDNPALDLRGESWLVHLFLKRQADGTWALMDDTLQSVTRRATWTDAPKTYRAAIVAAALATAGAHWTEDLCRQAQYASAAQSLHRDAPTLEKARAQVAELERQQRAQQEKLARSAPDGHWARQIQARQLPLADLKRHASVSTSNNHRCQECFTCACVDVLEELERHEG